MRRRFVRVALFLVLVTALLGQIGGVASAAGSWVDGSFSIGGLNGSRNYKLWVPNGYSAQNSYPLVVLLHGCTQDAADYAAGTAFNSIADTEGILVLYPEQSMMAQPMRCWNWPLPEHQSRGSGEPAIIAGMVNKIRTEYTVDEDMIYVAGGSAGGCMASIMGATYPDLFSAIGIASGCQYKTATNILGSFTAASDGGPDPDVTGEDAYNAMGAYARRMPAIVFHGDADSTLDPVAGDKALSQWAQTNDFVDDATDNDTVNNTADSTTNGSVSGGYDYTTYVYNDGNGSPLLEKWIIHGMGHAWSGGSSAGSYTDQDGPDAGTEMWRFFTTYTNPGTVPDPSDPNDTTAPTLTISPGGATFDALVDVIFSVNEQATVWYTTDGSDPTTSGTRTSLTNGGNITLWATTTLKAYAIDLAGNASSVATNTYTINAATTVTFTSEGGFRDGYVKACGKDSLTGCYSWGTGVNAGDTLDVAMRGFASFNTSSLPNNATILYAELTLFQEDIVIGRPFTMLGQLFADIKNGCFGSSCGLTASDFNQSASMNEAAVFTPGNEQWGSEGTAVYARLEDDALTYINKSGTTQFRVRFEDLNSDNNVTDGVGFHTGQALNSNYRPKLKIIYK